MREVRHERGWEQSGDSSWNPPSPPRLGMRERLALLFDHYGFWSACMLAFAVIVFLYVNADRFFNADPPAGLTSTDVQETAAEDLSGAAAVADSVAVVTVPLSITTEPLGASIYVDGDYVGISPVRGVAIAVGHRRISVQVRDYAPFDTLMTLEGGSASLKLVLRDAHLVALPAENRDALPETPVVLAEADQPVSRESQPLPEEQPPPPSRAPEAAPTEVEVEKPVVAEKTPATSAEEEPVAAQTEPAVAVETPPAAVEEAPVALVGELQIVSEPPGATVMMAGEEVGVTPLLLGEVETGAQQITLRHEDYKDFTTTVDVIASERYTVNGQLKQRLGAVRILARPWGDIYIDGDLHQQETGVWYIAELPPGFHNIRVVHPKLGRWEQVVEVLADEALPLTIDFNEGK